MRLKGLLAAALVVSAALATAAHPAQALGRRRLCAEYRCETAAQDRSVQILRIESRHPEEQEEAITSFHWAVWRPTGRAWPLLDLGLTHLALAGAWVAYAERSCDYESETCGVSVSRLDAQAGRRETNLLLEQEPPQSAEACLSYSTVTGVGITALVLADTGTMAWIQEGAWHVCELARDSRVPLVLASAPTIDPHFLRLADGRLFWREEFLHSAQLP